MKICGTPAEHVIKCHYSFPTQTFAGEHMGIDIKEQWSEYFLVIHDARPYDNIYDMVSLLYQVIIKSGMPENRLLSHFEKMSKQPGMDELDGQIEFVFASGQVLDQFVKYLASCPYDKKIPPSYYCAYIIARIDTMTERSAYHGSAIPQTAVKTGPLNKRSETFLVYPAVGDDLYQHADDKINFRKCPPYHAGKLNAILKNFMIIERAAFRTLGGIPPTIYQLCDYDFFYRELKSGNGIKLAFAPFCSRDFFGYNCHDQVFDIIPPDGEAAETVIDRYIKIIRQCMENDVHIVVFPELTLIPSALPIIRQYLADAGNHSIRLLVSGSSWQDGINTLYILSGQGDLICRYNKMVPYEYSVEDDPNRIYMENLAERKEYHNYIDIHGLGRVYFSICRDFVTPDFEKYHKQFDVDLFMVAAYSRSLDLFQEYSRQLAVVNHSMCFLCNACSSKIKSKAPADADHTDIGFVSFPMKAPKATSNEVKFLHYCPDQCSSECGHASMTCIQIIRLNPIAIQTDDQATGARHLDISMYPCLACPS